MIIILLFSFSFFCFCFFPMSIASASSAFFAFPNKTDDHGEKRIDSIVISSLLTFIYSYPCSNRIKKIDTNAFYGLWLLGELRLRYHRLPYLLKRIHFPRNTLQRKPCSRVYLIQMKMSYEFIVFKEDSTLIKMIIFQHIDWMLEVFRESFFIT